MNTPCSTVKQYINDEKMEQHILYIVIDYRGCRWKGITIYTVTDINLQQKNLFK